MKRKCCFLLLISGLSSSSFAQDTTVIRAREIDEKDYRFENTIAGYQKSENWRIWSFPINRSDSSMQKPSQDSACIPNIPISDADLNTSWIANDSAFGIGHKFEFIFHFREHFFYGTAYQFFGVINVFNGNCRSITTWTEYSRIKTLKVFYNHIPVCLVELSDLWHFQDFDIGQFFKNKYSGKYPDAPYEINPGDTLTFEIMDVYPGTKYKEAALTEFLIRGASN